MVRQTLLLALTVLLLTSAVDFGAGGAFSGTWRIRINCDDD